MKISLSWLKEYISIELPPSEIAKLLTMAGLEVEGIEEVGKNFSGVVVGLVEETDPHPDADKLCVAKVSDGQEVYQVVCGAPNCRRGLKTAFAKVGASLTDEKGTFKIKQAKLRGVPSFGMLCAGKELGISEDAEGICEFDEQISVGADVSEMYADTVFDVALTPNLAHAASVIGVARELSAVTGIPYKIPQVTLQEAKDSIKTNVTIEDPNSCPIYMCRVLKGVKVKDSPEWIKKRLLACGVRPINNVVDATNYVLLERGHPLHAFDHDLIEGDQIMVRKANKGEQIISLDNKQRDLSEGDLLICDAKKPVAIAGVIGGINSEVGENTQNILLESAYFKPSGIRKTSRQLGIQTDASRHFERGADPNQVAISLDCVSRLIQQLAGGEILSGSAKAEVKTFPEEQIAIRLSRINALLGTRLSTNEVETIWKQLTFSYEWDSKDTFMVSVPTYRVDISDEIDLIEEVARIYGYDNIPKKRAKYHNSTLEDAPIYRFEKQVRERLITEGLQEFITCDLIGPSQADLVKESLMSEEQTLSVLNPTSIEQSILRTSLLPNLLQLVKHNYVHQNRDIVGFELGRIHFKDNEHYKEQTMVGLVFTGMTPHHWSGKQRDLDFYDLKGVLENVFSGLNLPRLTFSEQQLSVFHPGRQACLFCDGFDIGTMGEIHPAILRSLKVSQRIYFAEFNVHDLFQKRREDTHMEEIPKYPGSEIDWTLTLEKQMPIERVIKAIQQYSSKKLAFVFVFDVYTGEKVEKNKQNVTFRLKYCDRNKTLSQEEVNAEHASIVKKVTDTLELRSS